MISNEMSAARKFGTGYPDPHAKGEGDEKEGQQAEGLARSTMLGEEQAPEGAAARQHAGRRSHHCQLYQQGDEDEPVGHVTNVS